VRVTSGWIPSGESARRMQDAASGGRPFDLILAGGHALNVFSGALERVDLGIAEGRVISSRLDRHARGPRIDMSGRIALPGLIEPHAHPDLLYGPLQLAVAAVSHGTTLLCADLLTFMTMLEDADLNRLLERSESGPARFIWALRISAEGGGSASDRLNQHRVTELIDSMSSIGSIGEMTSWRDLVTGDRRLQGIVMEARRRGMRIQGHLPGASISSLDRAAIAGVSDDHEATLAEEARVRLDAGYWLMIRHSTLRPDARRIASGLLDHPSLHRAMLTTDGPVAADLQNGHIDRVVREVIAGGIPPIKAIQMATINPATYFGLDQYVGSLSPGRFADVVAVEDLDDFRPSPVLSGGAITESLDTPSYPPGLRSRRIVSADLSPAALAEAQRHAPAVRLEGVITRASPLSEREGSLAALVAADGSWMVALHVINLQTRAVASSFTGSGDVLLLGQDHDALVETYQQLVSISGGIVTPEMTLELPLFNTLSDLAIPLLAKAVSRIEKEISVDGAAPAPLEFLLLFLTLAVLPELRLTPRGVMDVKTGKVVIRPTRLRV
jgi:adenine deaminase